MYLKEKKRFLQTLFVAHEHAFLKLFLKLSDRKAYKIGFIAEFE